MSPRFLSALTAYFQPKAAEAVDVDIYRFALSAELMVDGVPRVAAALASLALFPLDDDAPASDAFTNLVDDFSLAVAEQIRSVAIEHIGEIAQGAVTKYLEWAREHHEIYYVARYETILETPLQAFDIAPNRERFRGGEPAQALDRTASEIERADGI